MGDFSIFYQHGGLFMNVLSLEAAMAVTVLFLHGRVRRLGADHSRYLRLTSCLTGVVIVTGVLGSLFGFMDMCAMLSMTESDKLVSAAARASGIVAIPTVYALMIAIPLWTAIAILRARHPAPARQAGEAI